MVLAILVIVLTCWVHKQRKCRKDTKSKEQTSFACNMVCCQSVINSFSFTLEIVYHMGGREFYPLQTKTQVLKKKLRKSAALAM